MAAMKADRDEDRPPSLDVSGRRVSPWRKKQLDYKHQRRVAVGGKAYRKVRTHLPQIERQQYRRALNEATEAAERDEEHALTLAEQLRSTRRAFFQQLTWRREIPLREAIESKQRKRAALAGHKKRGKTAD